MLAGILRYSNEYSDRTIRLNLGIPRQYRIDARDKRRELLHVLSKALRLEHRIGSLMSQSGSRRW